MWNDLVKKTTYYKKWGHILYMQNKTLSDILPIPFLFFAEIQVISKEDKIMSNRVPKSC